jgi:sugar lactone lactonase YvrE/enterochelin esterase-like enzyme
MFKSILTLGLSFTVTLVAADEYVLGPDSQRQPNVPQGKVTKYQWSRSKIYPGTVRDYWIYVPAQYKPEKPACPMFFQDGGTFVNETGSFRTTIVFDNLIHRGDMPVTIGIFVSPGVVTPAGSEAQARFNRSYEYDAVGDRFPRFLLDEILPEVSKLYKISTDPNDRAIAGSSSGGNGAFNAAWSRPDGIRRVLSFIGGFTNLRGDHIYPSLVRKFETRPLRVFLQDGLQDVNVWSNHELALALEHAGYGFKLVIGTEGHNSKHSSSILPDALRWLWRDYPKPIVKPTGGPRHYITNNVVLDPDQDWELISQGHKAAGGAAVNEHGQLYFSDGPGNHIYRVDENGKAVVFKDSAAHVSGMMFSGDGRLYACQTGKKRIVSYGPDGSESVVVEGVNAHDLAVSARREVYFTDPAGRRVWHVDPHGKKHVVHEGIESPNGIRFSPDQSFLTVTDTAGRSIWSFMVASDGSVQHGVPFYRLEIPDEVDSGTLRSGAAGLAVDTEGFLYVATKLGIQICDPAGKTVGILRKPDSGDPSSIVFGGPQFQTLYVTSGDKVFRRPIRRKGALPWAVVKPPKPRL